MTAGPRGGNEQTAALVPVKGRNSLLVRGGEIQWNAMRKTHDRTHDLEEALRREGEEPDVSRIREANLERNGDISHIMREGD